MLQSSVALCCLADKDLSLGTPACAWRCAGDHQPVSQASPIKRGVVFHIYCLIWSKLRFGDDRARLQSQEFPPLITLVAQNSGHGDASDCGVVLDAAAEIGPTRREGAQKPIGMQFTASLPSNTTAGRNLSVRANQSLQEMTVITYNLL